MKGKDVIMHFKKNRGRGFAYCWSVIHRNYLMLRPRNAHPCFLEYIRCICDVTPVCLFILQLKRAIEQHPLHFHPYLHPWFAAPQVPAAVGLSCLQLCHEQQYKPSSSQHSYCTFSEYISILPPGSLDHVQISLSFSMLTV